MYALNNEGVALVCFVKSSNCRDMRMIEDPHASNINISALDLPYNPLKQTLRAQNTLSIAQLHFDYCLIERLRTGR